MLREGRNGELLSNKYRVPVLQDERVIVMGGSNGSTL